MKSLRGERLSAEYQKAVYDVIFNQLKNRTDGVRGLVSVTKADVAPDLKTAKIYVSILGKDAAEEDATFATLCEHAGFIRHELSHMLRIRSTPALTFILDGSMEYGAHIDEILNKLESDSEK